MRGMKKCQKSEIFEHFRNHRFQKRAQTEIIGVIIIVIILLVAGVFMLKLRLSKTAANTDSYTDPKLAQSFLNALMKTKTEKNINVYDIIKDCYGNKNDLCGSTTTGDCCDYAYETMRNALEATLGEWSRSYRLTVRKGDEKRIKDIPENSKCNQYSEKEQPGIYYILPPPAIIVTLEICKN